MAVEKIKNYNIHQNPATNENQFDVENYLNKNWSETKEVVNNNADELISVQGRVSALETDNTTNKQDISEIKEGQTEQNTNIESLQTELEKVEKEFNDYAIHGQASGEFIHLTDSARASCKIDIEGNVKQTVTEQSANLLDLTKLTIVEKPNVEIDNISANEVTFHATNNTATNYYLRFKTILKQGTYYLRKLYEMLEGTAVPGNNGSGVIFISKSDWSKEFVRLYADSEKGNFTLTEDTEVFITLILAKVANGKIRFYNLMLSKDDVEYTKHNSQSVAVPIQQEIFSRFDRENNKEEQDFKKLILNGTENYTLLTTTENYLRFQLDNNLTSDLKNGFKIYCENLKVVKQTTSNSVNEEKIIERDISLDKQLQIVILKSRLAEATANGLKQYLATNNIVAYCELEEPTKLDLTQEQIEALEKLDEMQTYKNITNITTDSIAILDVDYKKDLETWQKQQDDRITALEELLSTTQTSAMLIENLENDLLKEVE